jgi:uncharacterized protein (DUF2126 family)
MKSAAAISDLAHIGGQIDDAFKKLGAVVTAGGEPTLIADNHEHAEWNTAALGPTKLAHARRFAAGLLKTMPGALVTQTFGKQYPGEPIPRWVLSLHWRQDGKPLADASFFRLGKYSPSAPKAAEQLARALEKALDFPARFFPAYEDPLPALASHKTKDGRLLTPVFSIETRSFRVPRLTPAEKKKLAPLSRPAGWVLPLEGNKGAWRSKKWPLKDPEEIFLWPGESPIGMRLPLHRLPGDWPRRALTIETRNGELSVFFPPMDTLDDYLDLFEKVRACAKRLKLGPVVVEGYAPPSGGKLTSLGLAADPGVLEINLPPCADFAGYDRWIHALYAVAEKSGLRAFKYQYTGRKIGTGGGAHILLGGPEPDRSPFFLYPHLLPSLIRFFQHHPSLSYVFTGLFVGPSSQAPRVDESEYEVPYELELALRGIEALKPPIDRYLLDLILRNLLMDTLGNGHRAEISVDKLWNLYAPNGCYGLAEFRAIEMPPEPEMLMAVVALIRGLAAAFIKTPCTAPLKRWGATLHDNYTMPHFLAKDLREVLAFLNREGFDFAFDHFAPWFDFRFPVIGRLTHDGLEAEFRQAIEPWPLMGDASANGGTSRFVDASMDRIQIRLNPAADANRYHLLANGVPVSFSNDEKEGTKVGAVRYRMFHFTPSLQPHIPAHSPLRFELVDTTTRRVVAAKALRNWRPDQQNYSGLPQNDTEARTRVAERFTDLSENIGQLRPPAEPPALFESLFTTDLRFFPS